MRKRAKGGEGLEEARRATETERKLSVAVLPPASRGICHTSRDLTLSFTHL